MVLSTPNLHPLEALEGLQMETLDMGGGGTLHLTNHGIFGNSQMHSHHAISQVRNPETPWNSQLNSSSDDAYSVFHICKEGNTDNSELNISHDLGLDHSDMDINDILGSSPITSRHIIGSNWIPEVNLGDVIYGSTVNGTDCQTKGLDNAGQNSKMSSQELQKYTQRSVTTFESQDDGNGTKPNIDVEDFFNKQIDEQNVPIVKDNKYQEHIPTVIKHNSNEMCRMGSIANASASHLNVEEFFISKMAAEAHSHISKSSCPADQNLLESQNEMCHCLNLTNAETKSHLKLEGFLNHNPEEHSQSPTTIHVADSPLDRLNISTSVIEFNDPLLSSESDSRDTFSSESQNFLDSYTDNPGVLDNSKADISFHDILGSHLSNNDLSLESHLNLSIANQNITTIESIDNSRSCDVPRSAVDQQSMLNLLEDNKLTLDSNSQPHDRAISIIHIDEWKTINDSLEDCFRQFETHQVSEKEGNKDNNTQWSSWTPLIFDDKKIEGYVRCRAVDHSSKPCIHPKHNNLQATVKDSEYNPHFEELREIYLFCKLGPMCSQYPKRHLHIHTCDDRTSCEVCRKISSCISLPTSPKLNKKFRKLSANIIPKIDKKPFKCPKCPKGFKDPNKLNKHIRSSGQNNSCDAVITHECLLCGKGFTFRNNLTKHMLTHTGEKPHKCDICQQGFNQAGNLRRHMQTHMGEKPFQCKLCGKSFTRKQAYEDHVMGHSDVTQYQCYICGKALMQYTGLRKHLQFHEREKKKMELGVEKLQRITASRK